MWEVPAFGDDLGADDEVDFAGFDGAGGFGGGGGALDGVAGHDEDAGFGKRRAGFFGDAFDAGADGVVPSLVEFTPNWIAGQFEEWTKKGAGAGAEVSR